MRSFFIFHFSFLISRVSSGSCRIEFRVSLLLFPFSLLLLTSAFSLHTSAQECQHEVLCQHYANEWQNYKEMAVKPRDLGSDTSMDATFYHIDLEVAIDSSYIAGSTIIQFTPTVPNLDSVKIDLNNALTVDSVTMDSRGFRRDTNAIIIELDQLYQPGETVQVKIWYRGSPYLAGGYKGLVYETHDNNEPIIATLSTPYLAHYWYPCKDGPGDKPDSVYVDITIPDTSIAGINLMGVSNGLLDTVVDLGGKKKFCWKHGYPVPPYYVMMAISNYVYFSEMYTASNGKEFNLDYYVFENDQPVAMNAVEDFPLVMDVLTEKFGDYPFDDEKYGMTQLGFYSAIENQTNTIISVMQPSWFWVFVHELAHMWFGDMITCASWHHAWLNEGFASYCEALYMEESEGYDAYKDWIANDQYFEGGSLYLNSPDTFQVFVPIIYFKGSYALHMLRGVMGDSTFFESMNAYATDTNLMYKQATTEDFQAICESTSGMDLGFFFDQWIYDEYYPEYHFNFDQEDSLVFLSIYQAQHELYGRREIFEMPMEIKFIFTDASDTIVQTYNEVVFQELDYVFQKQVASVSLDPGNWILKRSFFKPNLPVGIEQMEAEDNLTLYPNPTSSFLLLDFTVDISAADIFVYSQEGRIMQIKRSVSPHDFNMSVEHLPPGIYQLVVIENEGAVKHSARFIKN